MLRAPPDLIARSLALYDEHCAPQRHQHEAAARRKQTQGDLDPDAPWLIILSAVNSEHRAASGLRDAGYAVWLPEEWREVWVGGRNAQRSRACRRFPAAPGLLLARHANDWAWTMLQKVDCVRGLVMVGEEPGRVAHTEAERWRDDLMPDVSFAPMIDVACRIGADIRVVDGPLAGFSGVVERLLSNDRTIQARVMIFGRGTLISLKRAQLEAA